MEIGICISHPSPHAWVHLSERQDWMPAPWQVSVVSYKWVCYGMPQANTFGVGVSAVLCQLGIVLSTLGVAAFKVFDVLR